MYNILTYNGAKFDNYILLSLLADNIQSTRFSKNEKVIKSREKEDYFCLVETRLQTMRIENIKFIDIARFMPGFKLSTLAKDFKCDLLKDE